MAHVDLAWTYSFQDVEGHELNRASRFQELFKTLVSGARAGASFSTLYKYFVRTNNTLSYLIDAQTAAGKSSLDIERRIERANLWMLRQDLAGYLLLGDPAVHIRETKRTSKSAAEASNTDATAEEIIAVQTSANPFEMENAVLAVLEGAEGERVIAERHGITRDELRNWVEIYKNAGRDALGRIGVRGRSTVNTPPALAEFPNVAEKPLHRIEAPMPLAAPASTYYVISGGPRRTVILSDLHLGNGGPYDAFAGSGHLERLLAVVAADPTRVIINGDGVDFLMNDRPLELTAARAVEQAHELVAHPATASIFAALGSVLERGGEVLIRQGNHDIELALPAVQNVFRDALRQPSDISARLSFQRGDAPCILIAGGARILITHGEQSDAFNKVDHEALSRGTGYSYSAGSMLVKHYMNPITMARNMRFLNFLKPDFQGALLAALAVDPSIGKLLCRTVTARLMWQLLRKAVKPSSFRDTEADLARTDPIADAELSPEETKAFQQADLGLTDRIADAELSPEETKAFRHALLGQPADFNSEDVEALGTARVKVARAALSAMAFMQGVIARDSSAAHFSLEATDGERAEVKRLAQKYAAKAVITGHTHAARWGIEESIIFANTGTWIWLMQLPARTASVSTWTNFLEELRSNPELIPERQNLAKTRTQFMVALVEENSAASAEISLLGWKEDKVEIAGKAIVDPA